MDEKDYLIHYGVLGMKWGVRKARQTTKKYAKAQRRALVNYDRAQALDYTGKKTGNTKLSDSASGYYSKAKKYQSKASGLKKKAIKEVDSVHTKIQSEKNSEKRNKLRKQFFEENKKASNIEESAFDLNLAKKEERRRQTIKENAPVIIAAGAAVAMTLLGNYGGAIASGGHFVRTSKIGREEVNRMISVYNGTTILDPDTGNFYNVASSLKRSR